MSSMHLVGNRMLQCAEKTYITRVYRYPKKNGGFIHTAETVLDSGDNIVSDGNTLEEVLAKQRQILPLALFSRDVLRRVTDRIPTSTYSEGAVINPQQRELGCPMGSAPMGPCTTRPRRTPGGPAVGGSVLWS